MWRFTPAARSHGAATLNCSSISTKSKSQVAEKSTISSVLIQLYILMHNIYAAFVICEKNKMKRNKKPQNVAVTLVLFKASNINNQTEELQFTVAKYFFLEHTFSSCVTAYIIACKVSSLRKDPNCCRAGGLHCVPW